MDTGDGAPRLPNRSSGDWFADLFGFAEGRDYFTARSSLKVSSEPGGQAFIEGPFGHRYGAGIFETPSLQELREMGAAVRLEGRLSVTNELGDVALKHAMPDNRFATFQVASQLNCLEFVGPSVVPENGVTGYVRDKTQGPACSIACGPATVYRNYFARVQTEDGVSEGQTASMQIDNLADMGKLLGNVPKGLLYEVKGGYTMADESQLKRLNTKLEELDAAGRRDELLASLRVGVHDDVMVTSSNWGCKQLRDPEQTVTQVFGSACAVAYNRSTKRESWTNFASLILEASYEATLWAAVLAAQRHGGAHGSKKVFLTCLGGGVFGNSLGWIDHAMRRAFHIFRHYDLDIRIITYSGAIDPRLQKLQVDFPRVAPAAGMARRSAD